MSTVLASGFLTKRQSHFSSFLLPPTAPTGVAPRLFASGSNFIGFLFNEDNHQKLFIYGDMDHFFSLQQLAPFTNISFDDEFKLKVHWIEVDTSSLSSSQELIVDVGISVGYVLVVTTTSLYLVKRKENTEFIYLDKIASHPNPYNDSWKSVYLNEKQAWLVTTVGEVYKLVETNYTLKKKTAKAISIPYDKIVSICHNQTMNNKGLVYALSNDNVLVPFNKAAQQILNRVYNNGSSPIFQRENEFGLPVDICKLGHSSFFIVTTTGKVLSIGFGVGSRGDVPVAPAVPHVPGATTVLPISQVLFPSNVKISKIAATYSTNLICWEEDTKTLWCAGRNSHGEIGLNCRKVQVMTPVKLEGRVKQLVGSGWTSFLVMEWDSMFLSRTSRPILQLADVKIQFS